ncbi:MAG: HEPN domain-containing protein [Pseudomonadota bacterium]
MKRRDDPEVAAWLEKADGDLRMARFALTTEDPLLDQACFHSQQAVEKALKALLVAAEQAVPKTHDLLLLADGLKATSPVMEAFIPTLAALTPYSVTPRYPSWLAPETRVEAEEAVRSAETLLDAVERMVDG